MAKGIAVPLTVTPQGGIRTLDREEEADKIIGLALSDNDNDNAFQQNIGLGIREIFNPANPAVRAKILSRILQIFAAFEREKQFKLVSGSVKWIRGPKAGEQTLEFKYINLETDLEQSFRRTFTAGGKV